MAMAVGQEDDGAAAPGERPDMAAHWLRWHHGTATDGKLRMVASRTCTRLSEVVHLWSALLEHASQARPRGSVTDFDVEVAAFELEIEEAVVRRVLAR
jgi:hypothetical protein